ncbi:hypothetical protein [Burkholderia sp. 9120]|uniref:hypothetical protein n=1 Tax=Burkholderiaceae TaxID=119060 RepID=UPI00336A0132
MRLLAHYKIGVSGKRVVVVGRSAILGKPMARWSDGSMRGSNAGSRWCVADDHVNAYRPNRQRRRMCVCGHRLNTYREPNFRRIQRSITSTLSAAARDTLTSRASPMPSRALADSPDMTVDMKSVTTSAASGWVSAIKARTCARRPSAVRRAISALSLSAPRAASSTRQPSRSGSRAYVRAARSSKSASASPVGRPASSTSASAISVRA